MLYVYTMLYICIPQRPLIALFFYIIFPSFQIYIYIYLVLYLYTMLYIYIQGLGPSVLFTYFKHLSNKNETTHFNYDGSTDIEQKYPWKNLVFLTILVKALF